MSDARLKPGWDRVAFGDVVRRSRERSSDPAADGFDRYVGLAHLEPGDLKICRWGDVADGTTFTNVFRAGQVLFGKRRAYQRKLAVADFDGVCSGDIYVFEPSDSKLLPELLPFICQTDGFFEHAVGTSAGSLSPRTNWKSLASYEFDLPPLDEQTRIAEVLHAAEGQGQAARRLSASAATLQQAAIDRAFAGGLIGESNAGSWVRTEIGDLPRDWHLQPLASVCSTIVDGVHKRPDYVTSGIPFVTIENLNRGPGIDFSDVRFVSRQDHARFSKRANPQKGDVLVSKDGTLGVARVVETDAEFSIFVSVALLKPDLDLLDPWFLRYYFDSTLFKRRLAMKSAGSALKHIHLVDFRESVIPVPPLPEQRAITTTIDEVYRAYTHCLSEETSAKVLRQACLACLLSGVIE